MQLSGNPKRGHRAMLVFVALGLLSLGLLSGSNVAWARPAPAPDHQTVPTVEPTPVTLPPVAQEEEPEGAALHATKRASVANVLPGDSFTYTISVRNGGDAAAGPVVVRDALPAEVELLDVRANLGQITREGQTVILSLDSLSAGAESVLEIDVRVQSNLLAGAVIENRFDLEHAGSLWTSPAVPVSLPPAQLPVTGGV